MPKKKISKRYTDIFHLTMFLIILLLFANYEVKRKTNYVENPTLSNTDTPYFSEKTASRSVITWK